MKKSEVLCLLFYKNFKKYDPRQSHVGLGNGAVFTAKVLKANGIKAVPLGIYTIQHIREFVAQYPKATHVVIEGTWINGSDIEELCNEYLDIEFVCREHSGVTFLCVQNNAVRQVREYGQIQDRLLNFHFSANNVRFSEFFEISYSQRCLLLNNLYPTDVNPVEKKRRSDSNQKLRISSYGALRAGKNHPCSAAAALIISRKLGRDLEFHLNVGREPGLDANVRGVRSILSGMAGVTLVEDNWTAWAEFRHLIGAMDLNLQPAYTETFNIVTADAIIAGVPSAVGTCVEWTPPHWQCDTDDPEDIARVGISLLLDTDSTKDGMKALKKYQENALDQWFGFFGVDCCDK